MIFRLLLSLQQRVLQQQQLVLFGIVSPEKDEVRLAKMMWFVLTFPSTTIRIDETILVQIRSDAIDAIVQWYHQVMGGGSRSLSSSSSSSSSLMDPPVAIGGVGTLAVRNSSNSSPMSSMTMTFCSSTNTADYCDTHATAISTTATATPSNKKNSIASASPSTFLLVTGPTESGKTKLIQYVLQEETRQQGGYFIRGTFDVLQHPDPYRTYRAFTDFFISKSYNVDQDVCCPCAMRDAIPYPACGSETCVCWYKNDTSMKSAILGYHDDDRANGTTATRRVTCRQVTVLANLAIPIMMMPSNGLYWYFKCSYEQFRVLNNPLY
jgi:hypothetical protein